MSFGPSKTQWSDGESGGVGPADTEIVNLIDLNQDGYNDLELKALGERYVDKVIPFEDRADNRIGSVDNIHFSPDRKALVGNLTTGHAYDHSQLFLQLPDRQTIQRLVLSK